MGLLPLQAGDRVAVVGGGPAGTFFAHALLATAERVRLPLTVDIHDPRDFARPGPGGCAHCGGIVSESLVQILAAEGLTLPPSVVRRGIGAYVVHMDVGSVRIESARAEERIASLYRGPGPRESDTGGVGLDAYLLQRAIGRGARHRPLLVSGVEMQETGPVLRHPDGSSSGPYQLLAVAAGVNSHLVEMLPEHAPAERARTYICEFHSDLAEVEALLGDAMHVFLLDLPHLEFAALIPKGDHITLCMLGEGIDDALVEAFLARPEVRACLPGGGLRRVCQCSPLINVRARSLPFGERVVFIGDAGVTRLFKDGIGAAFRTASAAAETAILFGVSAEDFRRHYLPICRRIESDNRIGRAIFGSSVLLKKVRLARLAILRRTAHEQQANGGGHMSNVLWNLFTGSAPYRTILAEAAHPSLAGGLARSLVARPMPPTVS